jgi:hypothetical protein
VEKIGTLRFKGLKNMSRAIEDRGWIGVDLDGTLAEYHGWPADGGIGPPIPEMLNRVKQWVHRMIHHEDIAVRIMTARVCPVGRQSPDECADQERKIRAWCLEHIGVELPVTYSKDFQMITLYDDRCIQVEHNTGRLVVDAVRARGSSD